MLHLYYGRETKDAYAFFFRMFGSGRHTVIVPDQFTHQAEAEAISAFGSTGLMDTEIISFTRLRQKILEETGGGIRVPLNEDGRRMLLGRILREKETELVVFRKMSRSSGFAEKLDGMIAEFKQYGTSPETLYAASQDEGNPLALRRKLADIANVYASYEDAIRGRYLDTEDAVRLTVSKAKNASSITDRTFWILGFDPFSPLIEELFGMLLVYAKDVHFALTLDVAEGPDKDLFRLSQTFAEKEKAFADSLGVPYTEEEIPDAFSVSRSPALAHMERNLFARRPVPFTGPAPEVTCVKASSPYAEIEDAAVQIRELVRDKGYRYNEIAVLSNDMETRAKLAKRVFAEYDIPVFLDEKKKISASPAAVYVLSLLESAEGARSRDVFRLLKTGFSDIAREDLELLENYAEKYHIKGNAWKKPFRYGKEEKANGHFVYGEEGMAKLEETRVKVANFLASFDEPFQNAKTAAEKTRVLYTFLAEEAKLPERIEALRDELTNRGKLEGAEELRQVWDAMTSVLEQLVELTGEEEISAEEYKALLESGLASKEIGLIPPAIDQVVIGPARRLATGKLRALFVIGANEGILPENADDEDLLSRDERNALLAKDRTFCKDGSWRSEEELLALYRDFTKPTEVFRISAALSDGSKDGLRESDIYTRIRKLFPENAEETGLLSTEESLEAIRASLPHLAKTFGENGTVLAGKEPEEAEKWKAAYDWFRKNAPETLAPVTEGLLFRPGRETIQRENAKALYNDHVSPSSLERYSRCPFHHFVTYGLRPEENRAFETDFRSAGDVYHEALMTLSKRLSTTGKSVTDPASLWMTVSEEELRKMCDEILEEVAKEYREGLLGAGEAERYRKTRIKDVLFETAKALTSQVRTGTIDEMYLEEPFSRTAANLPAVPVETSRGTYYLEGRIDRVDVLPGNFVKIIDYKSGSDTFRPQEAERGWRLQLMLYLTAALKEDATPGGALYFHITDKDVNLAEAGGSLEEALENGVDSAVRKTFAMNGIVLDNDEVLKSVIGSMEPGEIIESIRRKKDGSYFGNALIDETKFRALLTEVWTNVRNLTERLSAGDVAADPKKSGSESACDKCPYRPICMR